MDYILDYMPKNTWLIEEIWKVADISFSPCLLREVNGRGGEIRTHDLLNPIQTRYQATLRPEPFCQWYATGRRRCYSVSA